MANKPKNINDIKLETAKKRLDDIRIKRGFWFNNLKHPECYVHLQEGNSKTGHLSKTVSLAPVIDCRNCKECRKKCYDLRTDCMYEAVRNDRARNSAIHDSDVERYWWEVEKGVKEEFVVFLRINVGGDLGYEDYPFIKGMGDRCPRTTFQFFTKNTPELIRWYNKGNSFPDNIRKLVSKWPGMEIPNPYHWPEAHVLWKDGTTTAPEFGAYFCQGNCSACYFNEEGCPSLKDNEHVVMNAH